MLTDIFAYRYRDRPIWQQGFSHVEARLLVQCYQLVFDEVIRFRYHDKKVIEESKQRIRNIYDLLRRELGVQDLAQAGRFYQSNWGGTAHTQYLQYELDEICKAFITAEFEGVDPDRFMKVRLSFIELAFRAKGDEVARANLPAKIKKDAKEEAMRLARIRALGGLLGPEELAKAMRPEHVIMKEQLDSQVDELNTRFRQAGVPLNYHNGYIQISEDALVEKKIEKPFWDLVSITTWKNVATDMADAVDKRDNGDRDPAWYAAKALESTIKIISNKKGWTHGKENGAHNFIDNLGTNDFIKDWESDALKRFFTKVRNPFGHGPGDGPMPALNPSQTNWAIETCMSWVKSLITRL